MKKTRILFVVSTIFIFFPTLIWAQQGCIDPTNLSSPYVTGYYGSYSNPYYSIGIVNYGSSSSSSRHTVHTSATETDPRTGNNLHTVPPGSSASVRLGNWNTGGQAEALRYMLIVDTLVSDLLILKYAAVLEDPNHDPVNQPRFRLELLDSNMNVIDPICGVADFIANSSLGWNSYGGVLWKDWTTVGIDLSPFAGQRIYIRLTTYDCSFSAHYGYAYFTLECSRKAIQSMNCGPVGPNSFSVPMGFNYAWYTDTINQTIISTARTLNTTGEENVDYFYCRLSFVDKAVCNFTMNAYAGTRYPLAIFDTIVTPQPCGYSVNFLNQSVISADGQTPLGNGEGCETAHWDFGDGFTSDQYHATHYYANGGDYTVTLVSGLASDACTDTVQMILHLEPIDTIAYIIGPTSHCQGASPDTLTIAEASSSDWPNNMAIVSPEIVTTYTVNVIDVRGCPVTLTHTLAVNPSFHHDDFTSVCANRMPFSYDTLSITQSPGAMTYNVGYNTMYGCDSSFTLTLTVLDTSRYDTIASECDNFLWRERFFEVSTDTATYRTLNALGCDSVVHLHLTIRNSTSSDVFESVIENDLPYTYHGRTFYTDVSDSIIVFPNAAQCDSIVNYSLLVHRNVTVEIDTTLCPIFPITLGRLTFMETGTQRDSLFTQFGADSIVVVSLRLFPVYDDTIKAEICDQEQYYFGENYYNTAGYYTDHLYTIHGCDSISTLELIVRPIFFVNTSYELLCKEEQYILHMYTEAPFTRWYSFPHDTLLDNQQYETSVIVSPTTVTSYIAWVDSSEVPYCPVTDTLILGHLVNAHAELKVVPASLGTDKLDYAAYDVSYNNESHVWYIDWQQQNESGYSIFGYADREADSIIIALEHYNDQCRDTAIAIIPITHVAIFPPNVFTPLQDINNRFIIPANDIISAELFIYNRQGQLLFKTNDIQQGWDGRDPNGVVCPQGAYVWRLYYHAADRPEHLRSDYGTVLLLK